MAVVYQHKRKDNGEVFYIGIGINKYRSYSKFGRNTYWKNIVKKYGYTVEILYENISRKEAEKIETELIKFYGRKDLGLGNLVNLTDGGEKPSNISEITKKTISEKLLGNKNSLGFKHSEEFKTNLKSRKGEKHHLWGKESKKKGIPLTIESKIKNRESQPNRKKIKYIDYKTNETIAIYNGIAESIISFFECEKGSKEFANIQTKIYQITNNKPHRVWKGVAHYRKSYKGLTFELLND